MIFTNDILSVCTSTTGEVLVRPRDSQKLMTAHNFHPKYRTDIDGLRALAILPVVAYHAFPRYAPGGFIGVDIFFVISGYLISLIIFRSLLNNDFSFAEFYAHRIKRIFPALILVTATCYAVGWFALLPDEFKQLGKHIAAGMGFVQNFVLWKEAGYFDVASELKPLMHLWSLAVEEQFYLIFPLIVWAAWKARLNVLTGVIVLGVISFVLNQKGIGKDAIKTFFAPQTRFWELMAGSVLAYVYGFRAWRPSFTRWIHAGIFNRLFFREVPEEKDRSVLLSSILSFIGLALIVYSIAKYNHTMPYPGVRTVAPVLGAVLLILAGPHAWVNRQILSRKVVVWVGLISYPLYLWHWPLLSFARIVESETPSRNIRIAAIVISFVLAALTYYLIEKRVRYGRSTWLKVAFLSALGVVVGYVGYNAYTRDGLAFRVKELVSRNSMFSNENTPWLPENQENYCKQKFGGEVNFSYCRIANNADPTIQIIGDSHANALFPGMRNFLSGSTENVMQLGTGGCSPFRGVSSFDQKTDDAGKISCLVMTDKAIDIAIQNKSIHTVILWSRGPIYLSSKGFYYNDFADEKNHNRVLISKKHPNLEDNYAIWEDAMRDTLNELIPTKKVVFVLDNPELGFDPKSCVDSRPVRITNKIKTPCAIPKHDFDERNKEYRELVLKVLKDYPSVKVFDAAAQLCDSQWCWAIKDGKMLYRDDDHLSLDGSRLMASELVKLLH